MDLKSKLTQQLASGKPISSTDIGEFSAPEKVKEEVKGDVVTEVPEEAKKDGMVNNASAPDIGRELSSAADTAQKILKPASFLPEKVTITASDREAFLAAVVADQRLVLPFTMFNGKVSGKIRSRTQSETYAIIRTITTECQSGRITNDMEYSTRLRNLMLTAQIEELNGVNYAEMKQPLLPIVDGKNITPVGWDEQADRWGTMNDGLISALFIQLQIFERKYWTMVNNANEQNFWNPVESTSK